MLSLFVFIPLLFIPILFLLRGEYKRYSLVIAAIPLVIQCVVCLYYYFNSLQTPAYQLFERKTWVDIAIADNEIYRLEYYLSWDGLSAALCTMSSLILLFGLFISQNIKERKPAYFSLYLLMSTSVMGTFLSRDLFLFFIFFEFMLLPMYFLIGVWGGERREYAAIKFFIYTLLGSLMILIVFVGLFVSYKFPVTVDGRAYYLHTLNLDQLIDSLKLISATQDYLLIRQWAFWLLVIGFLIKLPAVPLHTWLPDAHVEAPTAISVILAGILLKIGGYGIIRIVMPLFPDIFVLNQVALGVIGVIAIMWGAYCALGQEDLKRLIAYSSISHMGFVLLGIASGNIQGIQGAIYQMVSHGFISSFLFIIVGILYDRTHDRTIPHYRGLSFKMPIYTVLTSIAFFASLGLPGFSGFIAEFIILLGSYSAAKTNVIFIYFTIIALAGIVITAVYYLWTFQKMFFGRPSIHSNVQLESPLTDVNLTEKSIGVALSVLILLLGIYPAGLLDVTKDFTSTLIQYLK